jgi:hypothetical protein
MVLQTTTIARQWMSSNHVETSKDKNATIELQHSKFVFCTVPAKMLWAKQRSGVGLWVTESVELVSVGVN